jgi:magnesium chelatase family protein
MVNSGFRRPFDRVVITLAPPVRAKQAASFELPVTLGVLAGSDQLASERCDEDAVVGEPCFAGHRDIDPTPSRLQELFHTVPRDA